MGSMEGGGGGNEKPQSDASMNSVTNHAIIDVNSLAFLIERLPSTMASLANLKELGISFNRLELVPEGLCLITSLVKLNIGKNFADLKSLPGLIGNLQFLEELDVSNNQIRVLPDSFGMLSNLKVLDAGENPLELPPRAIAKLGAQEVVRYMAEHAAQKERNARLGCGSCCCFSFFSFCLGLKVEA